MFKIRQEFASLLNQARFGEVLTLSRTDSGDYYLDVRTLREAFEKVEACAEGAISESEVRVFLRIE
jgi:hypothetical protein